MVTAWGPIPFSPTIVEASAQGVRADVLSRGAIRYVDAVNGNDGSNGLSLAEAYKTFSVALAAVEIDDTLFVARGGYTGNFATQLNAAAPFVNIIGMNATSKGFGPYFASSTSSEPTISIRARGMRISGIEFDDPALDAGIELLNNASGTQRPDFFEVDHCLFTGGKFGLDQNGGATYTHIVQCIFDYLTVSGGAAISATDTGQKLPGRWRVEHNEFLENVAHIDFSATVGNHGPNASIIGPGNVFQHKGQTRDADPVLDIVGGNGNLVVQNIFGIGKSVSTAATSIIEIGGNDRAAGNMFLDGIQTGDFAST